MGLGHPFLGFMWCPICRRQTRHYGTDSKARLTQKFYCERCKVLRIRKVEEREPAVPVIVRV